MYKFTGIVILFLFAGFYPVHAQNYQNLTFDISLTFVPIQMDIQTKFNPLPSNREMNSVPKWEMISGVLLNSIKYRDSIDQFNATFPFDIRSAEPANISEYNSLIRSNTLLFHQKTTTLWPLR